MSAVAEQLSSGEAMRFQAANAQGIKAVQSGTPGAALAYYEEAISICEDARVLGNYGDALARAGRLADARRAFERSIELDPAYDQSHYNLGVVLDQLEDFEASSASYARSIELRVSPAALNNLANAETRLLRLADAERHYRAAIKQGFPDARWNLSLCLMMRGKWAEAWDNYEFRPQMGDMYPRPGRWRGESLEGKTLLIVTEQGLGDSIFALRYIPVLRAQGAKLVVACEPALKRLIEAMVAQTPDLPPVQVLAKGQVGPITFDYETMAMSIPGYASPDGRGPNEPYLKARGVPMAGYNVGLCWNGSTLVGAPAERNIPLKLLKPLSEIPGVRLVSLQKGQAEAEMEDCGFKVHDAMTSVRDVYDTACVIASLDLVITVDTLIPHLAGALGKPTWLMNRFASCWQWGTPELDPTLYSTVAQFRQAKRGDWAPVVEHVAYGLRHVTERLNLGESA